MKKIFSNTFYQLFVIYSILILVISIGLLSEFTYHFEIFALILAILGFVSVSKINEEKIGKRLKYSLIAFSIIFIILTRFVPYIGNQVPIGYDAGLYKYGIENGLENKDDWILRGGMEPGFLYLMSSLNILFSSDFLLTHGFIAFIIILGTSIYFASREFFGELPAILSLLIYALSPVQFLVFSYMYYKNVIGLILLLTSIIFIQRYEKTKDRKNIFLAVISAGLLGSIHRPTFYIFGISYFIYAFLSPYNKGYNLKELNVKIMAGIAIILIAGLFYVGRFFQAITSILNPVASSFIEPGHAPGTFIDFTQYQFITLSYLPLSLLGLLIAIKMRKALFLQIWIITNAIIVYGQLFFFNRFIIHLDISAIIFAGLGFSFILTRKIGLIITIFLLASSGIITLNIAQNAEPLISEEAIDLISSISTTEKDSYAMSISSEYSPYVLAYSGRNTIAPGMFDHDLWTRDEWEEFWTSPSEERTKELMDSYRKPIYLFAGSKTYSNPCFSLYKELERDKIFKYTC